MTPLENPQISIASLAREAGLSRQAVYDAIERGTLDKMDGERGIRLLEARRWLQWRKDNRRK